MSPLLSMFYPFLLYAIWYIPLDALGLFLAVFINGLVSWVLTGELGVVEWEVIRRSDVHTSQGAEVHSRRWMVSEAIGGGAMIRCLPGSAWEATTAIHAVRLSGCSLGGPVSGAGRCDPALVGSRGFRPPLTLTGGFDSSPGLQ
jgi:hypothetical protein